MRQEVADGSAWTTSPRHVMVPTRRLWIWRATTPWVGWVLLAFGCGNTPTASPVPAATEPAPPAAGSDALGVGAHPVGGVNVALTEVLRASGDTLTVRWSYRNRTPEEKLFANKISETYLVDPVQGKKYLVVRDENDLPVTSRHDGPDGVHLPPGQTVDAWAKFAAPPDDVERISVYIPNLLPFEDIPIGR